MMNYPIGVCTSLDRATLAARLGADHIEPSFGSVCTLDEASFLAGVRELRDSGLYVDAMNGMLPSTTVLYGSPEQTQQTLDFVRRGMERAATVGCKTVVFGSGKARNIPQGMELEAAKQRIAAMAEQFCEIARPFGIRIAMEPLRAYETNFIHTVADALEITALCPGCHDLGINPDIIICWRATSRLAR